MRVGTVLYHPKRGRLVVTRKKHQIVGNKVVWLARGDNGVLYRLDGTELTEQKQKEQEGLSIVEGLLRLDKLRKQKILDNPELLRGKDGEKGNDGKDGIAGKPGKDGKDGKQGLKGDPGKDGRDGKDGKHGKDGYTPVKGRDYFDGVDGKDGKDGAQGEKGEKGEKGDRGLRGLQGETGGQSFTALVKTSEDDLLPGTLTAKITAGSNVTITETGASDSKKLVIASLGGGPGGDETDPIFLASEAANFVAGDKNSLDGKADKTNVLELDNADAFTPENDYEPATKKYVDDTTAVVIYPAESISLVTGTLNAGDVTDVQAISDGNVYDVQEVTGVPGYNIEFNFVGVTSFSRIWVHRLYQGLISHTVNVELYNYDLASWDTITSFTTSTALAFIDFPVPNSAPYIDELGNSVLRLYHISSGLAAHNIQVDYVALAQAGQGMATDHGALTGLTEDDHPQYHTDARGDARYAPVLGVDDNYRTDAEKTKLAGIEDGAEVNNITDENAGILTGESSTTLHTHDYANIENTPNLDAEIMIRGLGA